MNAIVPYSDSNQQPSVFNFNGTDIHIYIVNGQEMWIASDVCEVLDQPNVSQVVSRLDEDEKATIQIMDNDSRPRRLLLVNESGLYSLILTSRKKAAKAFKRWITHEVLPALRKTGKYELTSKPTSQLQVLEQMMAVFAQQQRQREALDQKQSEQAMQLEEITDRLNDADYYTVRAFCIKQRIDFTQSLLIKWGKEATALSRHREIERKETIENDRPTGRYHKSVLFDVCKPKPSASNQPYLLPKGE